MSYGKLNAAQVDVVRQFVAGHDVLDLGAGDLGPAQRLLDCGAERVYALDSHLPPKSPNERIILDTRYYHDYGGSPEIAFVSWPCNWREDSLTAIIRRASIVIYLGKCTDGTLCGSESFWQTLLQREVLAYSPDRANTLIVYGPGKVQRPILGEERGGLYTDRIWSYEEAETGVFQEKTSKSFMGRLKELFR
jgi:hypothetical protein